MRKTVDKKRKNVYLSLEDLELLQQLAIRYTGGNESMQISRLIQDKARSRKISLKPAEKVS
jgi:hypothetical protein